MPLVAGAALGYYNVYWSSWIIAELVRKRTEWIARRAAREACSPPELQRRMVESRGRVNALVAELSHVLLSADYSAASAVDLSWLTDRDDWPIVQTALAANAQVLVTENSTDFPLGEVRHGILLQSSYDFLSTLFQTDLGAQAAIGGYLGRR